MRRTFRLAALAAMLVTGVCVLSASSGCSRSAGAARPVDMSLVKDIRKQLGGGAAVASAASKGTPTGWATIKGRFVLAPIDAKLIDMPAILMPNNKDNCPPGKAETLVVGSGGGIKDVLIYLDEKIPDDSAEANPLWTNASYNLAASPGGDNLLPQQRAELEFDQKGCRFLEHVFAMRSNQKLQIVNSDPFGHNTNLKTQDSARPFDKTIPPGASAEYEPGGAEKRPFNVSCAIHPWMSARMIVRDNPYFAVSAPDGTFEIRDVPAGVELEFRVWQEQANYIREATINGTLQPLPSGRLKLKLDPGETRDLQIHADPSQFQ